MKRYGVRFSVAVLAVATFLGAALAASAFQGPPAGPVPAQGPGGGGRGQRGAPAGPPAPVPPAVAIQRPTVDELAKINTALKRFVDTNTSPDSVLMKKYADLINVTMPRANSAIAPVQTQVRTTERHDGFVETARTGNFDILFAGDSITDWWQQTAAQGGGADVQKKYFSDLKIANSAVAGDTTQGVLWGLQNGEGQGHKPKVVMLMIGTNNNSQGNSAAEIAEGVGAVIYELRKDFPDAKILLLAIFPRGAGPADASRMLNDDANKIIARLDDGKHVFFRNINDKFLDAQGRLVGFRNDNVHPNPQGYETWANAVGDTLRDWAR